MPTANNTKYQILYFSNGWTTSNTNDGLINLFPTGDKLYHFIWLQPDDFTHRMGENQQGKELRISHV